MSDERFEWLDGRLDRMGVLFDEQHQLLLVVAEGVAAANERMDRGFAELRGEWRSLDAKMDTFIREQSELNREFRSRFSNHDERIQTLERRRRAR